ncbi:MAG: ABC transporter ATP-binding protein [Labilithrix sp.]|nr:ABC transporter ATP-binding protein [Labilithrix sp.]MCW5816182.1 ABC transporter ATP-binding protein [Labilithrix sp.]
MEKKKGGGPPRSEELPPVPYGKLFRWGWIVVRGAFFAFAVSTLLGIVNLLIQQLQAQLVGAIVSRLQTAGMPEGAAKRGEGDLLSALIPAQPTHAFGFLAALTVGGVLTILAERATTTWSDTLMLARLQRKLHDRLLELGPSYHSEHASGETTAIVWRYANGAQMLLRDLVSFPVVRGIGLATAVVLIFQNLARLGDTPLVFKLVLLAGVLATPIISARGAKGLRAAFQKVRASDVAANEELQNSLAAPLEVQLMGAIPQRSKAFGDRALAHARNRLRASMKNDLAGQARSSIPRLLQLGFLGYGIMLATQSGDPAAAGAVVAVHALVPLALQPLQDLVMFFNSIGMAWPECESVIEILERPTDVSDPADPKPLPAGSSPIVLDDVVFTYPGRAKPVLDHVSFTFDAGKCFAIVGASGSGKSTIMSLVARLSDPASGRVRIGATDLKSVRLADLRKKVVRVAQFPLFVADTVRANFQLAKADATDEEIEEVARATGLWDVLTSASPSAPLDTLLPRDVAQGLSGGQRRLLAVSRALLLKPSVLLLDEPSAGLDNITLQKLIRFLKTQTEGLTVLVIDHDLEGFVAKIADGIAILEDGKIALSGTHDELMKSDNLYKRLVEAPNKEALAPPPAAAPIPKPASMLEGMMTEIDPPMMDEVDMPPMKKEKKEKKG